VVERVGKATHFDFENQPGFSGEFYRQPMCAEISCCSKLTVARQLIFLCIDETGADNSGRPVPSYDGAAPISAPSFPCT